MRIGVFVQENESLQRIVDEIGAAADAGITTAWLPQVFKYEALTVLALAGQQVPDIALGTAVVPTYPRHPMVMAALALTAQAATGNRLTLGIGLSHKFVVERMWGYSFDRPVRHMREYLSALGPLLDGEQVEYRGETLSAVGAVTVSDAQRPPLLVAGLGPQMLRATGELADGTITWMVGPRTVAELTVPAIGAAAAAAGRPAPRVVVGLPLLVTDDEAAGRARVAAEFAQYGGAPSYRAMLDREGVADPGGIALVGPESSVRAQIGRLEQAGATELYLQRVGTPEERSRATALVAADGTD